MEQVIENLLPIIRELVIVVGVPVALYFARQYIARIKDKDLSDQLDRAVTNAAGEVINKLGAKAVTEEVKPTDPTVVTAAAEIPKSNPEGVTHFGLDVKDLQEKVTKKVGVLTAPAIATEVK